MITKFLQVRYAARKAQAGEEKEQREKERIRERISSLGDHGRQWC